MESLLRGFEEHNVAEETRGLKVHSQILRSLSLSPTPTLIRGNVWWEDPNSESKLAETY